MNPTPVTEQRFYRIACVRRITDECEEVREVWSGNPDDDAPRSITAAEEFFRAKHGWTLHANGTATCGPCKERWETGPESTEITEETE